MNHLPQSFTTNKISQQNFFRDFKAYHCFAKRKPHPCPEAFCLKHFRKTRITTERNINTKQFSLYVNCQVNFKLFSYVIRKLSQEVDKIPFIYLQGPFLHYRQREFYLKKKKKVFRQHQKAHLTNKCQRYETGCPPSSHFSLHSSASVQRSKTMHFGQECS